MGILTTHHLNRFVSSVEIETVLYYLTVRYRFKEGSPFDKMNYKIIHFLSYLKHLPLIFTKTGLMYVPLLVIVIPYLIPSSWFVTPPCVSCTVMNAIESYQGSFSKLGQSCAADNTLSLFMSARKKVWIYFQ